jgi:hypothetical protein
VDPIFLEPGGGERTSDTDKVARAVGDRPPDPQLLASIASKYDFHPVAQPY